MNDAVGRTRVAIYRLVVRGELDTRFGYLFEPLRLDRVSGTTVLTGAVLDQTQLHGFIERIQELGLELISVQQLDDAARHPAHGR